MEYFILFLLNYFTKKLMQTKRKVIKKTSYRHHYPFLEFEKELLF